MNPLHEIICAIVRPEIEKVLPAVKAVVISYDDKLNRASVQARDWRGHGTFLVWDDVPVQLGGAGVHGAGPFPGDEVWLEFQNHEIKSPKIVALADEQFQYATREYRWNHAKQGAYLPDIIMEV